MRLPALVAPFALLATVTLGACHGAAEAPARAPLSCHDVVATDNSAGTTALFNARQCQGGGVTWAGLIRALASHQGPLTPVPDPGPGWTGAVYRTPAGAMLSLDEEADAVRVCADDATLLAALRDGVAALNRDATALARAMAEAPALEIECAEADGSAPRLPAPFPVPTPPP